MQPPVVCSPQWADQSSSEQFRRTSAISGVLSVQLSSLWDFALQILTTYVCWTSPRFFLPVRQPGNSIKGESWAFVSHLSEISLCLALSEIHVLQTRIPCVFPWVFWLFQEVGQIPFLLLCLVRKYKSLLSFIIDTQSVPNSIHTGDPTTILKNILTEGYLHNL